MSPRRSLAAACAAIALVAAGCSHHSGPAAVGRLVTSGEAEVATANGPFVSVHHHATLHPGDRVHVSSGTASVHLVPDGVLELRPDTQLRMDTPPFLDTGDMLVEPARHQLQIATDEAVADIPDGVTRLTRELNLTVKSYVSTSALEAAGRPALPIRAPRQATVTDKDLLPEAAVPLQYEASDAWDHRYLGQAEALNQQLQQDTAAFEKQLGKTQGYTPGFYKLIYPQLNKQPQFDQVFEQAGQLVLDNDHLEKPTSSLIAAAIALDGKQGTFADRWMSEFQFRMQRADWGLVAYDQGVTANAGLVDEILSAMGRAPLIFTLPLNLRVAALGGLSAPGTTAPPGTAVPTTLASRPRTTTPPTTRPPTTPSTLPPAPQTGVQPVDKLVDPLVDPLIDSINNTIIPSPIKSGTGVTPTTTKP